MKKHSKYSVWTLIILMVAFTAFAAKAPEEIYKPNAAWNVPVKGCGPSFIPIGSNLFGSYQDDKILYVREIATGKEVFNTKAVPGKFNYSVISGTSILAGFDGKKMAAWDFTTGKLLVQSLAKATVTAIFPLNDVTMVVVDDKTMTGFNLTNGKKLWEQSRDLSKARYFHSLRSLNPEKLMTLWLNRWMTKITVLIQNTTTGKIESTTTLNIPVNYMHRPGADEPFKLLIHGPLLIGGKAFIASDGISCLDTVTGKEEWRIKVKVKNRGLFRHDLYNPHDAFLRPDSNTIPAYPILLDDETIIFHDIKGMLQAAELKTGKVKWQSIRMGRVNKLHISGKTGLAATEDGIFSVDLNNGAIKDLLELPSIKDAVFTESVCIIGVKNRLRVLNITNLKEREQIVFRKELKCGQILKIETLEGSDDLLVYGQRALLRYSVTGKKLLWKLDWSRKNSRYATKIVDGQLLIYTFKTKGKTFLYTINPDTGRTISVLETEKRELDSSWAFGFFTDANMMVRPEKKGKLSTASSAQNLAGYHIRSKK